LNFDTPKGIQGYLAVYSGVFREGRSDITRGRVPRERSVPTKHSLRRAAMVAGPDMCAQVQKHGGHPLYLLCS